MTLSKPSKRIATKPWQELRWSQPKANLRKRLLAWYDHHRRPWPWRELFAESGDPYHVWVSEIMLQQTVIKAVIPVYERFLQRFPDVSTLAAADEEEVRTAVRGLGYYRRFRMLHAAAKQLVDEAKGGPILWPTTATTWRDLPGIGEYTSAAVASIAFQDHAGVVDGNVERVFCRLLGLDVALDAPGLKKAFWHLAQDLVPKQRPGDFNQALMELGQHLCTPTRPDCDHCPVARDCQANKDGVASRIPRPKQKRAMIDMPLTLVVAKRGRKFALVRRPQAARFLKDTWGFVTLKNDLDVAPGSLQGDGFAANGAGACLADCMIAGQVRHGITHHRLTVRVALGKAQALQTLTKNFAPSDRRWVDQDELEAQLVSNLDRKAWRLIERSLVKPT